MKTLIITLFTLSSLTAFAQRSTSTACSEKALSGSWKHVLSSTSQQHNEEVVTLNLSAENPLVMDWKNFNAEGTLTFVYKSLYSSAQLDQRSCQIKAHIYQTQSLHLNDDGEPDGTSDYNEADQDHLIKIEILSEKKIRITQCATDLTCKYSASDIFEKE